ncbi:hypothetical protein BJX66DRAFT_334825 [Aspergillus keveii]|uniref:Uncharacterized protein n=1 Tax=Aspergillus keveii TaxID=714993 RepID=A0ABR4GFJ5_9EURO
MLYPLLAIVLYTLSVLGQPTRTFEPWLTSTTYRIPMITTGEPLSEHTRTVLERGTVVTLIPSNLGPNPTASMIVLPPRDTDSSVTACALERRIDQIPAIPSNAGSNPTGPLLKPGPLHQDVFPSITTSVLERRTEVVTLIPTPSSPSPNPGIVLIKPPREAYHNVTAVNLGS